MRRPGSPASPTAKRGAPWGAKQIPPTAAASNEEKANANLAATIYAAVKRGLRRLSAGLRSGERDDNANPPPSSPTSKRRSDQRNRVVDEGRAESNWAPTAACERSNKTLTFKRTQGVGLKMQIRRTKNANAKNAKKNASKKCNLQEKKGARDKKKFKRSKWFRNFLRPGISARKKKAENAKNATHKRKNPLQKKKCEGKCKKMQLHNKKCKMAKNAKK